MAATKGSGGSKSVGNAVTSKFKLPSQAALSKNATAGTKRPGLVGDNRVASKPRLKAVAGPVTRSKVARTVSKSVSMPMKTPSARNIAPPGGVKGDVPKRPRTVSKRRDE